jgi:hypothetical protein
VEIGRHGPGILGVKITDSAWKLSLPKNKARFVKWLDALSGSTTGANSFCLKAWDLDKWDELLLVAFLTSWSHIALANSSSCATLANSSSRATFASFAM